MKEVIINNTLNYIYKNRNIKEEDKEIIKYGISNLYLQISKIIVITTLAIILKIFIPYIIFTLCFNIIRMPSFGIHASKSWQCWLFSLTFFILFPFLVSILDINFKLRLMILSFMTVYITIYSPADTIKRPIISKKRRLTYKIISSIIAIIYMTLSLIIREKIVSNALLFSLILQGIVISPITYKIFGMPYNNYKKYIEREC